MFLLMCSAGPVLKSTEDKTRSLTITVKYVIAGTTKMAEIQQKKGERPLSSHRTCLAWSILLVMCNLGCPVLFTA